jgi:predicted PolB exonuclease-like 3'-5' exonuclease
MKYLVVDLETVTDTDSGLPPPKKKQDGTEAMPPPPYHRVVVMGAALLDATYALRRIWIVGESHEADEAGTLSSLVSFLNERLDKKERVTIVSWNGRGFDLPVIAARCLRHGLSFPWYYAQREARYRFSAEGHIDLMDYLTDHGAGQRYSLDVAAKLVGLPGKLDCKGSDVASMIAAGQLEEVRAYCMQDVMQTAVLFLRVQLLRGQIGAATYGRAMRGLLAAIEREERLAPLLPIIDKKRLVPQAELSLVRGAA